MCASAVGSDRDPWSTSINSGVLFLLGALFVVVASISFALWRRMRLAESGKC